MLQHSAMKRDLRTTKQDEFSFPLSDLLTGMVENGLSHVADMLPLRNTEAQAK